MSKYHQHYRVKPPFWAQYGRFIGWMSCIGLVVAAFAVVVLVLSPDEGSGRLWEALMCVGIYVLVVVPLLIRYWRKKEY